MTPTRKTLTATAVALVLMLSTVTAAGALPWKIGCAIPMANVGCKVADTAQTVDRKANAVVDAGTAAYGTAESAGSLAVSATELTGSILDKANQATQWTNDRVQQLPVPTRTLAPGECIDLADGRRYCMPASTAAPPAPCVLDRNGRRWCVVR